MVSVSRYLFILKIFYLILSRPAREALKAANGTKFERSNKIMKNTLSRVHSPGLNRGSSLLLRKFATSDACLRSSYF